MYCKSKSLLVFKQVIALTIFFVSLVPTISNGQKSFNCGVRKFSTNHLIVRGQNATASHWPWHATILHQSWEKPAEYACGGTLIHKSFVITVRHCTVSAETGHALNAKIIKVQFGVQQLYEWSPYLQQHNVLIIHKVNEARFKELKNDIALLELKTEVLFNDHVIPICLPEMDVRADDYGTVVGFGFTENNVLSTILRKASMPVIATGKCVRSDRTGWGGILDEGLFCVGYLNGTTVCNGDSGGGLVFYRSNTWQLGGMVSFALGNDGKKSCQHNGYGAFTNVYVYLDWIRRILDGLETTEDHWPNKLPSNCGRQLVNRVRGGANADWLEFPWLAQIQLRDDKGQRREFCLGTLISKRYVLTSAFCANFTNKLIYVELGEYDRIKKTDCNLNDPSDCAPPVRVYEVEKKVVHPDYEADFDFKKTHYNIALLRLSYDIPFEVHIQPVCLPVTTALRQLNLPAMITTRWNNAQYNASEPLDIVHKRIISVTNRRQCGSIYRKKMQEYVFCAGKEEPLDDNLENGAPIGFSVQNRGIRFTQFGIWVFRRDEYPKIYTNVSFFMDWILDNIEP